MLCDAYICISMTLGFDYVVILVCGVCMAAGGGFHTMLSSHRQWVAAQRLCNPPPERYCRRFDSWGKPTRSAIGWTPHS